MRNGTEVSGLAAQLTDELSAASFTLEPPSDNDPAVRSQIIVYHSKPLTVARLQRQLRNIPVVTGPSGAAPAGVDIVVVLGADYRSFVQP